MTRSIYELPREARIRYCSRIFIRHKDVDHADSVLRSAMDESNGIREAFVGYIKGWSRCGKSETVKRFITSRTGANVEQPLQLVEGNGDKILYVDVQSGATVLGLSKSILMYFSDVQTTNIRGQSTKITEQQAVARLVTVLQANGVSLLVLDEFQNLFRLGSSAAMLAAASFMITIENARAFPVVATGTPLLDELFAIDDAVGQRKAGLAYLKPFAFETKADQKSHAQFIDQFEKMLPFEVTPGLSGDDDMLMRTFYAWRGRPGILAKLYRKAASLAFDRHKGGASGPKALTLQDMIAAFDFSLGQDPTMMGVNPWRDKTLPKIPLSIEAARPIISSVRTRKRGKALIDG